MPAPVTNSLRSATTLNHFQGGRRYSYQINAAGMLEIAIERGAWQALDDSGHINPFFAAIEADPSILPIEIVAADNNRVFIRTKDNRLYWRCLHEDSASWVIFLFTAAEIIGSAPALLEDLGVAGAEAAARNLWAGFDDMHTIEGQSYPEVQAWAAQYRLWVEQTHIPGNGWNSLQARIWRVPGADDPLPAARFLAKHEIIHIAVGNWNNTVVTYYALTRNKDTDRFLIYFLDEEALMQAWEPVPAQDKLPLCSSSRLCGSHSVVAVTSPGKVHWIRFDAHTNDHIPIWPLNWNEAWVGLPDELSWDELLDYFSGQEPPYDLSAVRPWLYPPIDMLDSINYPGWHSVDAPVTAIDEFIIDTSYSGDPWPVPKPYIDTHFGLPGVLLSFLSPAWTLHTLISRIAPQLVARRRDNEDVGFLGDNPVKPNCNYPLCCTLRSGERYWAFNIAQSTDRPEWGEVDPSAAGRAPLAWVKLKQTIGRVCLWAESLEEQCGEWREDVCTQQADQGYRACSQRADQGYAQCCTWWPCSWACQSWVWISNWVCVAWTWVANIVCIAWTTIVHRTCRMITGGVKAITCWARSCSDR